MLVIGGTGLLGTAVARSLPGEVLAAGSRDVDIRSRTQIQRLMSRFGPDCVVHAAAFTNVDACEGNPSLAFAVNCLGAEKVARAAADLGCWFMLISTDYVFDGAKQTPYETTDPMNPINTYGRSKAEGELAVRRVLPDCCVARTSWVFGVNRSCFPEVIGTKLGALLTIGMRPVR